MKSRFVWVVLALVCLAAGAALWRSGRLEQRLIAGQRELLLMRYETNVTALAELETSTAIARFPWNAGLRSAARAHRAQSHYWQRDYASLAAERNAAGAAAGDDPATMLLAANAAYRRLELDGEGSDAADRLLDIGNQYLEALKRNPALVNAAYNYEFVARRREGLARKRRTDAVKSSSSAVAQTIHGLPGAEAATSDMGAFKVIIPHQKEERQQRPSSAAGDTKKRKG
ncbi:MAG: hypothetical protein ABL961_17255 [Vicinamibacterales bacterium]